MNRQRSMGTRAADRKRIEELCDEIGPVDLGTGYLDPIDAVRKIPSSPTEPPEVRELRRIIEDLNPHPQPCVKWTST